MALGVAVFVWSAAGNAAFPAMNMTISLRTGISYGTVTLVVHTILFIFEFIFGRKYIHIGTVFNWVCFGYLTDGWMAVLNRFDYPDTVVSFIFSVILGMLAFTFGIAVYQDANVGIGPLDVQPITICERKGWNFMLVRLCFDTCFLIIALLLGGFALKQIGVVTVLSSFCIGPMVGFFSKKITRPWIWGKEA